MIIRFIVLGATQMNPEIITAVVRTAIIIDRYKLVLFIVFN
jgi:hypothetical protein